jgi:hypothetical protein
MGPIPSSRTSRCSVGWSVPDRSPSPQALIELREMIRARRGSVGGFELIVEISPSEDVEPWTRAGATWALTSFGPTPRVDQVRAAILAGPR